MDIDLDTTTAFMTAHARVLDRHRFARLRGDDGARLLGAAEAYRNPDGGYGWGLEPDLRSVTSQPGAALHALEAFADAGPATTPRAAELCDWLDGVSLPDGGLPFALPIPDPAPPSAPLPRPDPPPPTSPPPAHPLPPRRPARRSGSRRIRASPRCRSRRRSPARRTASPHTTRLSPPIRGSRGRRRTASPPSTRSHTSL